MRINKETPFRNKYRNQVILISVKIGFQIKKKQY